MSFDFKLFWRDALQRNDESSVQVRVFVFAVLLHVAGFTRGLGCECVLATFFCFCYHAVHSGAVMLAPVVSPQIAFFVLDVCAGFGGFKMTSVRKETRA